MTVTTAETRTYEGSFDGGGRYIVKVPAGWNGTLLTYTHHYRYPGMPCPTLLAPTDLELGPRMDGAVIEALLLERGYALAGTADQVGWMMAETLRDQPLLLDWFAAEVGTPERTYAWGTSPGGLAAQMLVQLFPRRWDGALSLGADSSGVMNQMNLRLDAGYAVKTLLGPDSGLQLGRIDDPEANVNIALGLIMGGAGSGDPRSGARLLLAGAVANMVPVNDSHATELPDDLEVAVKTQAWQLAMSHSGVTYGAARKNIEERAGGNPMWNTGVDYRELYARSTMKTLVEKAYAAAGADLSADLDLLNGGERIEADPAATRYLIRTGGFPGLTPVPVVTVHTTLDGAAPVEHDRAYADRVAIVGTPANLKQLHVARGFTCTFSPGDVITAFDVLRERVETGAWGDTSPETLNAKAGAYPAEQRRVFNFSTPIDQANRYEVMDPAFVSYHPAELPRNFPF
jgi:hypothetical protein